MMLLNGALLAKWLIATLVIVLLLAAFYLLLRIIKQKNINFNAFTLKADIQKMKVVDQFYLDSKNKIVKVKDGDKVMTLLLGQSVSFIKEELLPDDHKSIIDKKIKLEEVENNKDVK